MTEFLVQHPIGFGSIKLRVHPPIFINGFFESVYELVNTQELVVDCGKLQKSVTEVKDITQLPKELAESKFKLMEIAE